MAAIQRLDQQYELYAPDVPVAGENLFDQTFLAAHLAEVQAVDALWADERSRRVYRDLIAYKLTGKLSYLVPTASSRQEVFSDLLQLGPKEFYADLGAYNGDTIEEFLQYTGGRFAGVYGMEPDPKNYRKLCERAERLGIFHDERVSLWNLAAWDDRDVLTFAAPAGTQFRRGRQRPPDRGGFSG